MAALDADACDDQARAGALRALYLYRDGQDTLYRLHGTTEPQTIGTMVSSVCVRFLNQDIIDLYRRVPVGSRAVVLAADGSVPLVL